MDSKIADKSKKWDYEIGYFLTCDNKRIGKFLAHYELYKKIIHLPGDIVEFGVYKGSSLMRLIAFRDLLENPESRKIIGFDAFGRFPKQIHMKSDIDFVERFEEEGGDGISLSEIQDHINNKETKNLELIEGDILQTLQPYITENPSSRFSLVHIDVDVFEPSMHILESIWARIVPGGILMLDDYGTVEGETKAVDEFFKNKKYEINKLPYYKVPAFIIK